MKLMDDLIMCKGFAICRGMMTAGETYSFTSANTSSDGIFSQLGYCVSGSAILYDSEGTAKIKFETGNLYDVRDYYGKDFNIVAEENGGTWICINPTPASKFYTGVLLKENTTKTIKGTDKEQVVMCLNGEIVVNDKTLKQFQYARILKGKTAKLTLGPDTMGIYFYT